jgi:RNA polymerase sigma-70 factor (ECF subfamily)
MPQEPDSPSRRHPPTDQAVFTTTHWSVVLAAGQTSAPGAGEALETLCRIYWRPLYVFVRRQGHPPHDAQDLTQEFFARFLAKNYLGQVGPDKGRFRSFLLASLKHFLANEWDRAKTRKRGGEITFIPWDDAEVERQYHLQAPPELPAEKVYDRQWTLTLLDQVFDRLREEYAAAGKSQLFDAVQAHLSGAQNAPAYAQVAGQLQMSEGAVKVAVHRLRRRYGELLRAEIAQTLADPGELEDEMRFLFAELRR